MMRAVQGNWRLVAVALEVQRIVTDGIVQSVINGIHLASTSAIMP